MTIEIMCLIGNTLTTALSHMKQGNYTEANYILSELWQRLESLQVVFSCDWVIHDYLQNMMNFIDSEAELCRKNVEVGDSI